MPLKELLQKEDEYFRIYGIPIEGRWELNKIQRAKIRAMKKEQGQAWLGRINVYKDWKQDHLQKEYKRGLVRNFQYDYALPCYDKQLEDMVKAYNETPIDKGSINSKVLCIKIDEILARIKAIGGYHLTWV